MSPLGLVRRHPLGLFFAWFFTVGQALAFVPVITGLPSQPFLIAATFVGLLLPAVAITRIVDGPEGLRALRRRTFRAGVAAPWFVFAVIAVPAITAASTVVVARDHRRPAARPDWSRPQPLVVGLVHAAANAVAVGSVLGAGLLPRLYGDTSSSGLVFPVLAFMGLVAIVATRARLGDPAARSHPADPAPTPASIRTSTV